MAEAIIKTENLKVIYNPGKSNEVRSLDGVSVEIFPQEYIIIYGPSGCGKSTLLYSIAGLQRPTEGMTYLYGKNIGEMNKKEMVQLHRFAIGMIFQAFYLIPTIHTLFNVCLPRIFQGEKKKERQAAGMQLLRRFGIAEQARKFPGQLSGGQKQRVAIARSLINNPSIILADEPVGNLDSESAENVMQILKELNTTDKKTVVLVTHNPEHLHYADRIIHMKDGKIVREEVNREKRPQEAAGKEAMAAAENMSPELRLLMRTFKNLSLEQVGVMLVPFKAKQLLSHILSELSAEQLQAAENLLKELLFRNLDAGGLERRLDEDMLRGGAGWNKQRAESFTKKVEMLVSQAERLKNNAVDASLVFSEYLSGKFELKLDDATRARFVEAVELRLKNELDAAGFQQRLDAPRAVDGVGLYKNMAEKVVREVEMIMLLKYSA